ncbi:dUTP diphosphatase [Micromonospora sp. CPCC 206060]|uniref:dUTP diphosphatase n=1 Tax=Micromonospora sp. CPCC 206060 TaxID=3122406 RepID=UPI002FEECF91
MTEAVPVSVRRLVPDLPPPAYAHPGDAGADLVAACDVELPPGGRALVPTGVAIALPPGHVGLVHPRSGLAARLGVTVLNAPGTVDAGYRGEILINLINHDPVSPAKISRGDRIAQLVVQRVERAEFRFVDELPDSPRGTGGHGSTGGHASLVPARAGEPAPEVTE